MCRLMKGHAHSHVQAGHRACTESCAGGPQGMHRVMCRRVTGHIHERSAKNRGQGAETGKEQQRQGRLGLRWNVAHNDQL